MKHYAGIDVSLEWSSVCVVDAGGVIVRKVKVLSEPEALIAWFAACDTPMERIGLEAAPYRNGCTGRCRRQGCRLICWRHAMCARPSGPCQ